MRALFWVQHLLGTGHLRRAITLSEALAERGFEVTLASGGPPAPWLVPEAFDLVQLAPLRAGDESFSELLDEHDRPADEALWAARRERLLDLLHQVQPEVLITEMFPFGRRVFRAELLPLLEAAGACRRKVWRLASLRDILVSKADPSRCAWMRDVALAHYDRVLVHTDPALVPFDLTFPYAAALGDRLVSTGYVAPPAPRDPESREGEGEVLVSSGGGRVGRALLETAVHARALSRRLDVPWRLLGGQGLEDLRAGVPPGLVFDEQRRDFTSLLANSLLSVSQAGYNTVVEALGLDKPMVLVPFETRSETEQRVRAERLARMGLATVIWESALTPKRLARAIDDALERPRKTRRCIHLDGAEASARLVLDLVRGPPS